MGGIVLCTTQGTYDDGTILFAKVVIHTYP